ncbi:MAG: C25 family cysteine peptidase, partial [Thermoanaerobaculia bacterium]
MALATSRGSSATPPRFRILTAQAGVYRVPFESVAAAGHGPGGIASASLALSSGGRPVPMAIEDGGDATFGPGDHLEFVAPLLHGEASYHHEIAAASVYWLESSEGGARIEDVPAVAGAEPAATLERRIHLEEDRVMIRLSTRDRVEAAPPELWFWSKLTHLAEPLRLPLDLADLDVGGGGRLELVASFRGLSDQFRSTRPGREDLAPDHTVAVFLADRYLGKATWNGRRVGGFTGRPQPAAALRPGPAELVLRVPRRASATSREPIVDVVMLDWIELRYPHDGEVRPGQVELWIGEDAAPAIELSAPAGAAPAVYTDTGRRVRLAGSTADSPLLRLPRAALSESFWLVQGPLLEPAAVERDEPSDWASPDQQADYLMIAHSRLRPETERLAAFHRGRGLAVAVADVQDLYDEFNHGVPHHRA